MRRRKRHEVGRFQQERVRGDRDRSGEERSAEPMAQSSAVHGAASIFKHRVLFAFGCGVEGESGKRSWRYRSQAAGADQIGASLR